MFFFRVKHMRISEKTCHGLTDHTRQRLLMFLTLCQLMTRRLFGKCSVFFFFFFYKVLQRRNDFVISQTDA